jgi:hypothetical protein
MKNFIKEIWVILTILIFSVFYVRYFLLHSLWGMYDNLYAGLKLERLYSEDIKLIFSTWKTLIPFIILVLWFLFLIWQIFTQFRKNLRNYILLFLTISVLGFIVYLNIHNLVEITQLAKGTNDWVIYPPLSALPQVTASVTNQEIEEITWQLRGIEVILGCLCLFLVYRIYQNNRNILN